MVSVGRSGASVFDSVSAGSVIVIVSAGRVGASVIVSVSTSVIVSIAEHSADELDTSVDVEKPVDEGTSVYDDCSSVDVVRGVLKSVEVDSSEDISVEVGDSEVESSVVEGKSVTSEDVS